MRSKQPPAGPIDFYVQARPLLRHVRVMRRFMHEVVDNHPVCRKHYAELHCAFMDILNEEFVKDALTLALAVVELEEAYPEIDREATEVP
jgi:hypothetical protein